MKIDGYEVEALTPERFNDLVTVLGEGGIGGCWCMYWISPTSAAWSEGARGGKNATNRYAFRSIVEDGPPPGLLAYEEGPVAWCRVMERRDLPGLANSRYFRTDLDIDHVWSLACFVVRSRYRGRGLTTVLTKAAVAHVAANGGGILEAYPWDTEEKKASSTVYTGLASTFSRLGFDVVQRRSPHKPMMRLTVPDHG
jgi:hypothetical protein